MQIDAKSTRDAVAQVDTTKPHHAITGKIGTFFYPGSNLLFFGLGQARRTAAPGAVGQPYKPRLVIAMNPVAQGLSIHAAGLRSSFATIAIQHHGNRQNAPRLLAVRGAPGRSPKFNQRQIRPCNRYRNHATPRESEKSASTHICPLLGIPSRVRTFDTWYKLSYRANRMRAAEALIRRVVAINPNNFWAT